MDLKDLLSFQPNKEVVAEKRPSDGQASADGGDRKRRRVSPPRASSRSASKPSRFDDPVARLVPPEARVGVGFGGGDAYAYGGDESHTYSGTASGGTGIDEEERQRILRMVEEANPEEATLDTVNVRKMLLSFERKALKNREMRIKYPDDPQRFLESEVEVHDELQQLHALSTVPHLYPLLCDSNSVPTLLGLLAHDNSDVALGVIDLLHELTDINIVRKGEDDEDGDEEDEEKGAKSFVEALIQGNCLAHFVQNMERLDEKQRDDQDGVHNTLGVVENLCEFCMDMVCSQAVQQGLMHWLVKRVKVRSFDSNKLYASEILAILLQNSVDNRRVLGDLNGVDILLQSLAVYKRRDPASNEETELMENVFDCLCLGLMHPANRQRFLDGEGPQLMILILKEKRQSFSKALKVLDHALSNPEGADNCTKFVEVFGLRSLFPLFMKTPKKKVRHGSSRNEHEEHVCAIMASLFRNLSSACRQRLLNKFKENDFEKVDRLMELHDDYYQKVLLTDRDIDLQRKRLGNSKTSEHEDEFYLRRLDSGLFTLQNIDVVLAEIIVHGHAGIRARATKLLSQHGDSIRTVKRTLKEYSDSIGDADSGNTLSRETERHRIAELLTQL